MAVARSGPFGNFASHDMTFVQRVVLYDRLAVMKRSVDVCL